MSPHRNGQTKMFRDRNGPDRKVAYPLKTPKAVYSASEQKYTAAGEDIQVPLGGIHEWWKSEQRDWYADWKSKRSSAWDLLVRADETGAFKDRKAFSF